LRRSVPRARLPDWECRTSSARRQHRDQAWRATCAAWDLLIGGLWLSSVLNWRLDRGRRLCPFQNPALDTPAGAGLTCIHPALRIDRDHVRANELPGLTSRLAEAIEDRQILAPQNPHAHIRAVDEIEEALLGIAGELQAEAAAGSAGFRTNELL